MKQRDVNFKVKNYVSGDEYKKDGCPTLYFEFKEHEYYGLIAVTMDLAEFENASSSLEDLIAEKACQNYLDTVAGETIEEIEEEGSPHQVSKSEALLKFLLAEDTRDISVNSLTKQFEEAKNGCLLVDSSLL